MKLREIEAPEPVEKEEGAQTPVPLFVVEDPGLTQTNHLVAGEIRYSEVSGTGFLEMWTCYGEKERYFSRTLGDLGPMAKIAGSSEWRPVMLPFRGIAEKRPTRLEVNVVLPGGGKVEFRNFALYEAQSANEVAWWPEGTANNLMAAVGAGFGFIGAICGTLGGMGRARRLVLGILMGSLLLGIVFLLGGVVALFLRQPHFVWFPLILLGGVVTPLCAVLYLVGKSAYTRRELRAISAAG